MKSILPRMIKKSDSNSANIVRVVAHEKLVNQVHDTFVTSEPSEAIAQNRARNKAINRKSPGLDNFPVEMMRGMRGTGICGG
jgi:hypothetical protein